MEKLLKPQERQALTYRHRKERDKRICDRIKAILLYDDGYSYTEISRILLLDDETIRRHITDYKRENKLTPMNGGSDSKLTDKESRELLEHLQEVTYLYVKAICAYVKQRYGKSYSISGMTKWLHAQGFCYKKPHAVPAKADREKQEAFIKYYTALKAKAGKDEAIYFADSVHPQHQTALTYGWILKGERKAIATTACQRRLHFIGGICLEGHRFIYREVDKVNAEGISDFLKQLRKVNRDKKRIHVIWDNAGPHKDKEVQKLASELGITLHYLPPYSPNLNPIERLWKLMHENVRYNQYYGQFCEFTEATLDFFKNIGRKKTILRKRITDNFHILHSPLFAS